MTAAAVAVPGHVGGDAFRLQSGTWRDVQGIHAHVGHSALAAPANGGRGRGEAGAHFP